MKKLTQLLFILISLNSCEKKNHSSNDDLSSYYILEKLELTISEPHQVNILFQVKDENFIGVPNLQTADFTIEENSHDISSEASAEIASFGDIPFTIYTTLVLDVSTSVEDNLAQIKSAAISLVNTITEFQLVKIVTFSSKSEVIVNYTNNKTSLINAINSISMGLSSTNLYGMLIDQTNWKDEYSLDSIIVGNLIVLTDGNDTQASSSLSEALNATKDKDIYMLGLGNEMDQNIMKQLGQFYPASDVSKLENAFLEIQDDIQNTAMSVYFLTYQSPKRGNNEHNLTLKIVGNSNTYLNNNHISAVFNSSTFYD